jgi:flagellar hook-associated protein 3 FlgL
MVISRVTQNMIANRSMVNLQSSFSRLSKTQEQLSTGRAINRPSDDPVGTTTAMRLRSSLAQAAQHQRNAEDGAGWLQMVDTTLSGATELVRRAKELGIQGVNGSNGPTAMAALGQEVSRLRDALLSAANTTYLGRPIFGGVTTGKTAYDASGNYVGTSSTGVMRTVATGDRVRVDQDAAAAFGPNTPGSPPTGDVFADLAQLANDLTSGNLAGIQSGLDALDAGLDRMTSALADVGTRANRLDRAVQAAKDATLTQTQSLSEVENVDLASATVQLKMQEVAYQAALGATSRVIQPSLLDFLR